jgi:radical SAM superfamily enzyme YgiQ (UPF0313 family)
VDKASADGQTQALDLAKQRLATIASWDYPRLENERMRFHSVYKPVSILPPDQYLSVVLQATEGCHWNRCTFCDFYRHTSFHIKSPAEFVQHMEAVKNFFGDAIRLRPRVFLGDANALVIPQETLLSIFDQVNSQFPMQFSSIACPSETPSFRGIYSFIDVFTGVRKSASDFQELNGRNLRRVYLGVETGCDDLLQFLNKPASSQATYDIVGAIKQAGVGVGVILLVGVGGDRYYRAHIDQTLDLVNHLNLHHGDILYFSPLWESSESEYDALAAARGIRRLTDVELREQLDAIRQGLDFDTPSKPKVALYDIREFIY